MGVLLENVNQQYLSVLKETAKAMNFNLKELNDDIPSKLKKRILSIENGQAELIKPDRSEIMNEAASK